MQPLLILCRSPPPIIPAKFDKRFHHSSSRNKETKFVCKVWKAPKAKVLQKWVCMKQRLSSQIYKAIPFILHPFASKRFMEGRSSVAEGRNSVLSHDCVLKNKSGAHWSGARCTHTPQRIGRKLLVQICIGAVRWARVWCTEHFKKKFISVSFLLLQSGFSNWMEL